MIDRRKQIAIHESGHAIAATCLGLLPVSFTLLPDSKGGHVNHGPANELTIDGCRAEIVVAVAGGVAERIAFRHKLAVLGMDSVLASRAATRILGLYCSIEQIQAETDAGEVAAEKLLRANWPIVRALARDMERLYATLDEVAMALLIGGRYDFDAPALRIAASP